MRGKKVAPSLAILWIALTGQAVAQEKSAKQRGAVQVPDGAAAAPVLEITARTNNEIAGVLRRAGLPVSFSSKMETPSRAVVQVQVGDVILDAQGDNEFRTQNGHGHDLSVDENAALAALARHLKAPVVWTEKDLSIHEAVLLRAVQYWGGAPVDGALLDVMQHSPDEIAGTFRSNARSADHARALEVQFSAWLATPSRVQIRLQLGDHFLTSDVDLDQEIAILEGSGLAVSSDELQILVDFASEYERFLTPDHRDPLPHEDFFYRVLSIWAQHEPGWTFESHVVTAPATIEVLNPVSPEELDELGLKDLALTCTNDDEFEDCHPVNTSICWSSDPGVVLLATGCECGTYHSYHNTGKGVFS